MQQLKGPMSQNILLIQDDSAGAEAVQDALINSTDGLFHVEWLRRCSAGLERLAEQKPHLNKSTNVIAAILLDLFLPDSGGIF